MTRIGSGAAMARRISGVHEVDGSIVERVRRRASQEQSCSQKSPRRPAHRSPAVRPRQRRIQDPVAVVDSPSTRTLLTAPSATAASSSQARSGRHRPPRNAPSEASGSPFSITLRSL